MHRRGCGYDKAYAECEHSQYQCTDTEYERCGTGILTTELRRWIPGRNITYTPQKVRIKGEAAILNTINKITIPEEVLDITDATSNIEKTVDISTYLPSGTALVISSDSKIDVTVVVEAVKTKTLQIPVTNLQVIGLSSDEKYSMRKTTLP